MTNHVEPEAEEDLKKLNKEHQRYVKNRLAELQEKPTGHKDSDTIRVRGKPLFKYAMKENSKRGDKDYRAVYDIQDNQIKVIAIFHRDKGYDKETISDRTRG